MPSLYPDYTVGASYAVKLSRDADLYLEDEFSGNLKEMIEKSLSKRETNVPG
jgi:polyphosphate kinase